MQQTSNGDAVVRLNLQTRRGDTFNMTVKFWQNDLPENLTGVKFYMNIICAGDCHKKPVLSFQDYDFINESSGVITTSKQAVDMNIRAGVYYYELYALYPDGYTRTRMCGDFIINENGRP